MMRKGLALLMCVVLCVGCGTSDGIPQTAPARVRTLTVAVGRDLSDPAAAALDGFAQKVQALSDGTLTVSLVVSDDPIALLDDGSDLLFASGETIARADGNFLSYGSPFYFSDYKHLSLTLNSDEFVALTGDATRSLLNAESLGAFYDGNRVFVTLRDETLETIDQFDGLKLYLEPDEMLAYTVERLHTNDPLLNDPTAEVIQKPQSERIAGFNSGRFQIIDIDTLSLEALRIPPKRATFHVSRSFHAARIHWLMLSEDTRKSLSPVQLAVLREAVAFALAINDDAVLAAETRGFDYLQSLGCSISSPNYAEFAERADVILRSAERFRNLWDWQLHAGSSSVRELAQY